MRTWSKYLFLDDAKKVYVTYKTEDVNIVAKISDTGVFTAQRIFLKCCGLPKSFALRAA